MLASSLIKAGYLLGLSASALAAVQLVDHKPVSPNAITPMPTSPESPIQTLPGSCHTAHECYTRTSLVPSANCPTPSCAPAPTDLVCPLYIKVSSVTVPCATDCCPTTRTVHEPQAPCPTCDPCRIPTEWVTYTTGCAGTPTITETNTVTPAY